MTSRAERNQIGKVIVEVKAYLAEIGLDIDDSQEAINPDAAKADGQKAADDERARVLLLELDLLELETA